MIFLIVCNFYYLCLLLLLQTIPLQELVDAFVARHLAPLEAASNTLN